MKTIVSTLMLCGLFGLYPVVAVIAQNNPHILLTEARQLFENERFQDAETRAEKAYELLKASNASPADTLAEAASLTGLAAYKLEKYGGAQPFLAEAIGIWDQQGQGVSLHCAQALYALANCHYYRDQTNEALVAARRAGDIRSALLPPDHCDLAETQRLMGKICLQAGEYTVAKRHFNAAVAIARACAGEESVPVADAISGLGIAAIRLSQYDSAVALQEQALAIRFKLLPPEHPDLALSYLSLGEAHKMFYKFDLALYYYEKALAIRLADSDERGSSAIAYVFSEMGQYHLSKKDYASAKTFFERENDIMVRIGATESSSYAYTCSDLSRLYFAQKDYEQAAIWADRMVAVWRKNSARPNTQLAAMLTHSGRAKLANGDTNAAMTDFLTCKQLYSDLVGPDSYLASKADYWIGNVYLKQFRQDQNHDALQAARTHFSLATLGAENQVRQEANPDAQRKIWAESVPAFEKAIEAEYSFLTLHPQDPTTLEKAWQLCEAVHGQLLLLANQEANARQYADIPDEHLRRDSMLRAQIVLLEKESQQMLQKHGLVLTDTAVLATNAKVFEQKESLKQHRRWIEEHYPDYHQLKHARQQASIAQTQALLRQGQTLLEYFTGDSAIYVFVLRTDTAQLFRLPKDKAFENWMVQCREGITRYHTAPEPTSPLYEKMLRQYAQTAQQLYEALLAPLSDWLSPELLVVPDDKLANLPFEVLLKSAPRDLSNFVSYPFLLRQHSVHYAYSATLLRQMTLRQHRSAASGVLAMAPFFEGKTTTLAARSSGRRDALSALPFSGEEVARVKKLFGPDALVCTGADATDSFFRTHAGRFSILHLATHGKANHKAGEFSYLAFAGQPNPVLFSVGELYNLRLNADLVLLSACETAIGERLRGDGVISLARAFAYAGAKSIVASLWSVNDKSTMYLMDYFYAGIGTDMPKDLALAQAKRLYLERNPGQPSHPFFWAGFVGVGDAGAVRKN